MKRGKKANSHLQLDIKLNILPNYKRSQITIFIIIAIIIIERIFIYLFFRSSKEKKDLTKEYFISNNLEPSFNNIIDFNIDCLEVNSKDALETIGIQGGYYIKPQLYYDLEWAFLPYYYYLGQLLMPNKEKIEQELSLYIDSNLPLCLEELNENFKNFKLTFSKPKTKTSIQDKKVIFNTELQVRIENDGKTTLFELNKYPISVNSSLNNILEIASYITESHKQDPNFICINCLAQLSKEKNVYIDFIAFEPDSTLVMIIENSTQPVPYIFQFLNKYEINKN